MRPLHKLAYGLLTLLLLAGTSVLAQSPRSKALIVEKVDDNQLVTLKGNTPPAANAKNDLGRVSGNLPMTDLILALRRSPEMEAAFDAFVAGEYDVNSPNYHQWLTPEQIGERFGPALADINTVSAWLSSHGLTVDEVSKDRMSIRFSGTARQVEAAFHTQIHNLVVKGEPHIANMSDPQIPMALDAVVVGPKALHNFIPRPLHRLGSIATLNSQTGKWERVKDAAASNGGLKIRPEFGLTGSSGGTTYQVEDVAPFDFATIYNVLPVWNASIDGTGQTIAVAGTSDINVTDVANFKSTFGLPAGLTPIMKLAHGTDPGRCTSTASPSQSNNWCTLNDQIENSLDVEWSGAIAPGAQIVLVVSGYNSATDDAVYQSANYAVQNDIAKILNVSYGECELGLGTAGNTTYNNLWKTAYAAGIAVFVATGDSGSPACDQGGDANGTPYTAQYGLQVSGLSSTPFDTGVGGTDLNWPTTSPYWNSTNNSSTGASAAGYMPEIPWNDTCTNPTILSPLQNLAKQMGVTQPSDAESACNFVWNNYQLYSQMTNGGDISFLIDTVGAGGGESNCTTSDGATPTSCTGGYSTPSWQAGVTGLPSDGKRYVPDVSFFAGNGFLSSAYLICVSDWAPSGTQPPAACITRTATTEPAVGEIGGTSAATPAMAGVMALINQKAGSAQGSPNTQLYQLAGKQTYSSCKSDSLSLPNSCYFNDVVLGTITMPCAAGSQNCKVAHSGDALGLLTGYDAGVGFDRATGLGTLNVANVVNGWTSAVGTATATVAVSANPTSFTNLNGTALTITVSGSSGTPTGTVVVTSGTFVSATKSLTSGTVTFNLSPGVLAVGTDTITATYGGDSTYATASGTVQVTVSLATFTLSASAPASISAGGTATSNITVNAVNGYAGTVTLSCALTSSPANAVEVPTCAPTSGQSTVILNSGTTSGTGQVTVSTTAAPSGAFRRASNSTGWFRAAGGAAMASLLLFFVPVWSKRYRNMLGVVLLVIAGSFFAAGCGGGGGSSGGPQKTTPTVTVTPAKTTISETDSLQVAITVAGSGSTPTGSVTMTSGSYNSGSTALSAGTATITIPVGKLATGSDTLTVSYGGDSNFNSANGTATVTVNKVATTSGTYTFTVTGTGNDAATTTATTTFTVTVN